MEEGITYGTTIPFDISQIEENHDDDDDENYARMDVNGILCATWISMKKIEDCAQSISVTPVEGSIHDDAIAQVLGPERRGRVRDLGFGATPSKVDAQIQSNGRVRELESQLPTQLERMGTLEENVEALLKLSQQSQQGSDFQGGNELENTSCQLLHWYKFDGKEVVVEGKIASTDPSAKVHHMPLG
ncbi:Transposase 23 domain-containing protein [Abeliophyllum distichum]|uniref:Transposase 23 domain-containing protein n=1 Tax=Abeliophyllum distichum TaxID=126358 RepID=A0ABD1RUD3_9LAMI